MAMSFEGRIGLLNIQSRKGIKLPRGLIENEYGKDK